LALLAIGPRRLGAWIGASRYARGSHRNAAAHASLPLGPGQLLWLGSTHRTAGSSRSPEAVMGAAGAK